MAEYEDMPVVLVSGAGIGACPACGCNGAMAVGTSNWKTLEFKSWFTCYGCNTDWRAEWSGE